MTPPTPEERARRWLKFMGVYSSPACDGLTKEIRAAVFYARAQKQEEDARLATSMIGATRNEIAQAIRAGR